MVNVSVYSPVYASMDVIVQQEDISATHHELTGWWVTLNNQLFRLPANNGWAPPCAPGSLLAALSVAIPSTSITIHRACPNS